MISFRSFEAAENKRQSLPNSEQYEVVTYFTYSGTTDLYLVHKIGTYKTILMSQKNSVKNTKFWNSGVLVFPDGNTATGSINRIRAVVQKQIEYGTEAAEYIAGHRTPTEFWRGKINARMEAARISHVICDKGGKAGHDLRQGIRREILSGQNS